MIIEIGYFAVIIALMVSIAGILTPLIGLKTGNPAWIRAGRQAVTANFILLSLGCGTLIYSFLSHDFSVKYVAMNSNSRLPVFYTVSALWEAMRDLSSSGPGYWLRSLPWLHGYTGRHTRQQCHIS